MNDPLVSVLIPTYNGAEVVAETLESTLGQTYDRLEVVVADDSSSDETAAVVAGYAASDPQRVRLLRFPEREGPCRRRNDALAHARGTLIAWLDHDDIWLPHKLERQVPAFQDPSVGFVYSDYEVFDSATGHAIPSPFAHRLSSGRLLGELFVEGCFPCSSTVVFRRAALERRGLHFLERDFSFGDDYHLWLALSLDWAAICVPEVLVRYRRHDRNESRRRPHENFHVRRIELLRELLDEFPEANVQLGRRRRAGLARHYLKAARFEARRRRLTRAAGLAVQGTAMSPSELALATGRFAAEVIAALATTRISRAGARTPR